LVQPSVRPKSGLDRFSWWNGIGIASQFLVAAAIVLFVAAVVIATWVNDQIKSSVVTAAGEQAGAYMSGFLEPYVQELRPGEELAASRHSRLDALFLGTELGETVVSAKIWRIDGTVLYSTSKDLIGQQFASSEVARAAQGQVIAEFENLKSAESANEEALDVALIEVYAPLHRAGTTEIIAVGEIYQNAEALSKELSESYLTTWLIVVAIMLLVLTVLYLIVHRGGATIASQRTALNRHVQDAQLLAEQNHELRISAERARLDASEANEQLLARIGSDLHDGPIQVMSLLMLKLSEPSREGFRQPTEFLDELLPLARETLADLRNISSGLSLPEIRELPLENALRLAVFRHQDLTEAVVNFTSGELPENVSEAVKICAYRVIQEGLSNSNKYAKGGVTEVSVVASGDTLLIDIRDNGPGMPESEVRVWDRQKLGLAGMRNRVGALKGTLQILSGAGQGTRIFASLPLSANSIVETG
jgi:signal transduction histidine kinase